MEVLRKEPGGLVFALEPHLWESHFDIPCRLRAKSLGVGDFENPFLHFVALKAVVLAPTGSHFRDSQDRFLSGCSLLNCQNLDSDAFGTCHKSGQHQPSKTFRASQSQDKYIARHLLHRSKNLRQV